VYVRMARPRNRIDRRAPEPAGIAMRTLRPEPTMGRVGFYISNAADC
jgi:hypothetical protein